MSTSELCQEDIFKLRLYCTLLYFTATMAALRHFKVMHLQPPGFYFKIFYDLRRNTKMNQCDIKITSCGERRVVDNDIDLIYNNTMYKIDRYYRPLLFNP